MKNTCSFVLIVICLACFEPALRAEDRVVITMPPGPAQWPRAGFLMLKQRSVDRELRLSAQQRKTLDLYQKQVNKAYDSIPNMFARVAELNRIYYAAFKALKLSPKQTARLYQIHFQLCYRLERGLVFGDYSLTKRLALSQQQAAKVSSILQDCRAAESKLSRRLNQAMSEQARLQLRQQAAIRIGRLLTSEQKKTWRELKGPPFRGTIMIRGRPIRLN